MRYAQAADIVGLEGADPDNEDAGLEDSILDWSGCAPPFRKGTLQRLVADRREEVAGRWGVARKR